MNTQFMVSSTGKTGYLVIEVNDIAKPFILLHPVLNLDLINYAPFSMLETSNILKNAIKNRGLIRYFDYDQYNNYTEDIFEPVPMIPEEIISGDNFGTGGSADTLEVEYVANENILQYQPVTSTGLITDTNDITKINKFIGLSLTNTNTGFTGKVVSSGLITNPSWSFPIGSRIFLSNNSIGIFPSGTAFMQKIGNVVKADTIFVNFSDAIKL